MGLFGPTLAKVEKWAADGNVDKLVDSLKSEDAVIRETAAQGLARIGGPQVLDYCRKNAQNENQDVRWHITQILGLMGTPDAMKILETVEDPTDRIRRAVKKRTT